MVMVINNNTSEVLDMVNSGQFTHAIWDMDGTALPTIGRHGIWTDVDMEYLSRHGVVVTRDELYRAKIEANRIVRNSDYSMMYGFLNHYFGVKGISGKQGYDMAVAILRKSNLNYNGSLASKRFCNI